MSLPEKLRRRGGSAKLRYRIAGDGTDADGTDGHGDEAYLTPEEEREQRELEENTYGRDP